MIRLLLLAGLVTGAGSTALHFAQPGAKAGSTVRVQVEFGHGSGVHIGNGYIITAQHVVEHAKEVKYQADNSDDKFTADVMWANAEYDVALLRTRGMNDMAVAPMSCRDAVRGEQVDSYGNPLGFPFFASRGSVSVAKPTKVERWQEVIVVSAPIGVGMSGGPVLDAAGYLLGITVGAAGGRVAPFGVVVPVKTICALLARS